MPFMQACFTRCGQPIPMRVDRHDYLFTENEHGDFIANITDPAHEKHLLETGNFKLYEPPGREEMLKMMKAGAATEENQPKSKADVKPRRTLKTDNELDAFLNGDLKK